MMMEPDPRSRIAELEVLKVKIAELSANDYLVADFLSRGNHRRSECSR
jgi:hypothetical protein